MSENTLLLLLKVVDGIAFAVEHNAALRKKWQGHLKLVRTLIEENREPTEQEWAALEVTAQRQTDALRRVVEADNAKSGG